MDYFSVVYQGMSDTIKKEEQLSNRLSDLASRLNACWAKAGLIGSLRNKGYVGKIYDLASGVGNRQTELYRMSQGLMKACDAYREYELQVLRQAEDVITAKNGFSKKMVKKAKKAASAYENKVEKNRYIKGQTFGSFLYDNTVAVWKENWKGCKEAVYAFQEIRKDMGEHFLVNVYGWLEEQGVDGAVLGTVKKHLDTLAGTLDSSLDTYENILLGVVDFQNPEAVKNGLVEIGSAVTGAEGIDVILYKSLETMMPGSDLRNRYEQVAAQVSESFQNGDYLEGALTYITGNAGVLGQGITDTTANIAGEWAEKMINDASMTLTGEEASLVDALNGGESLLNDFAGWLNGMKGAGR